jgi:hypothetical protein
MSSSSVVFFKAFLKSSREHQRSQQQLDHNLQNRHRHIARLDYGTDFRDHDKTNLSFAIETALVIGVSCWSRIEKHSAAVSRNQFESK